MRLGELDYHGRLRARRAFGIVVPGVLLVTAAAVVWAGAPVDAAPTAVATRPPSPAATSPASPSATSSGSASSTPPGTKTSTTPGTDTSTLGQVPTTGPGVTTPGISLRVTLTPAGTLDVWERVRLSTPTTMLQFRPPRLAAVGLADLRAEATSVQLSISGQPVALAVSDFTGTQAVTLDRPVTAYELRYVLDGAVQRSLPSTSGRAIAGVGPLSVVTDPGAPVTVATRSAAVRNIACPLLVADAVACADGAVGALSVQEGLTIKDAVVLLQLDLPTP